MLTSLTRAPRGFLAISLDQCGGGGVGGAAAKMPPSRAPSGNDDGGGADSMFGAILK